MTAALEYAPRGLVGVLTPQANTTVEPEMAVLTPPGHAFLNARLVSDKATIPDRLRDYFEGYEAALGQFANAPLAAVGYACTGASYLARVDREDATLARLTERAGAPVVTAATAVVDALAALGARRVALVSPYDAALDEASAAYWTARGLDVVARTSAFAASEVFHPIYSLTGARAEAELDRVEDAGADAVVMLGTGMPTLGPIARRPRLGGAPVLSCMLCLGWRLYAAARGEAPDAGGLRSVLDDPGWRERLARAQATGPRAIRP